MATARRLDVPEAEATMAEAMYERTKGRVVVGHGMSGTRDVRYKSFNVYLGEGINPQED